MSTERIAQLEQRLAEMNAAYEAVAAERDQLQIRYEMIAGELDALKRRFFARSSEKQQHDDQPQLFDEPGDVACEREVEPDSETTVKSYTRSKGARKPLSDALQREEILIDISDDDKRCGCGHELVRIGEEVSEKLSIIPARFIVKRYIRPKYACHHCEGSGDEEKPAVRIAAMPPAVIPRGIATPSLLAFIITAKYVDGMPLHRQETSFARIGVDLPRARMADWIIAVAVALQPVMDQLLIQLRAGPVLLVDETTVQVLGEENRSNTSLSYMWCAYGGDPDHPAVVYQYAPSRSTNAAAAIVGSYSGFLQADGYEAYDRLARNRGDLRLVGCWAHVRRKFVDSKASAKKAGAAEQALALIARLYRIETELADHARDDAYVRLRREKVEPVLQQLRSWLDDKALRVPPHAPLGKAVTYALGQWDKLAGYLDSPYLTPDTNRIENKIRPFVVGRNAWMFSGSPRGAAAGATLYSLIETAKANGLEPHRYLLRVIERVPSAKTSEDYRLLLPQYIDLNTE